MRRLIQKGGWLIRWVVVTGVLFAISCKTPGADTSLFVGYKKLCCGIPYILDKELNHHFIVNHVSCQPLPVGVVDRIKTIPEVIDAIPCLLFRVSQAQQNNDFLIASVDTVVTNLSARMICSEHDVVKGQFLDRKSRNQAVVEVVYAATKGILIGETIKIAGIEFKIVGFVNTGIRPGRADVYIPVQDVERIIGTLLQIRFRNFATFIGVESQNDVACEKAKEKVKEILGATSFIATYNSN